MSAIPDEIRDLFPLRVRPPGDDPRPRVLNIVGKAQDKQDETVGDDVPDDGATATSDAHARRLSPTRAIPWECLPDPPEDERPIVQQVAYLERKGAKAYGRSGCVTRLKRALEALCGGRWTSQRLVKEMQASGWRFAADDESVARQLSRLESGMTRIDEMLVVMLARTFGVELDDLVFMHDVCEEGDSVDRGNPISALEEERNTRLHAALRGYEVTLAPLGDEASCRQLAMDIANPAAEKELRPPYRTAADDVPRERWPDALRHLDDSLSDRTAPLDQLARDLQRAVGSLERAGFRAAFGRHIRVVDSPRQSYLPQPGDPERCVTVVVSHAPGDPRVHVGLLPSWRRRPTWREECLHEGDLSVVPGIRKDIAWCGHWEGRWFPFLPLDAPDWLKQEAERRAGV
jgi:hypothetical protein